MTNCSVTNSGTGNTKGITAEFLYDIDHRLVTQVGPGTSKMQRASIYAGGEFLAEDAPDAYGIGMRGTRHPRMGAAE
jgi:hypothetical protein